MKKLSLKKRINSAIGYFFSLSATLFIIWSAYGFLISQVLASSEAPADHRELKSRALKRLADISRAQEDYIQQDRNSDGKNEYAKYLVHLWQSVSEKDSSVIPVRLIDEDLALVSATKDGLEGYKFKMLRLRGDENTSETIDYTNEWAAVAYPASPPDASGSNALPALLIVKGGTVWSKDLKGAKISTLPLNMPSAGWVKVNGV